MHHQDERAGRPFGKGVLLIAVLAALSLIALLFAACDNNNDGNGNGGGDNGSDGGPIDYGSLRGQIRVDGSSTVFPISEAMAEEFSRVAGTRVNVAFSGTGGGFEKFCAGETQISDASRPIEDNEVQACADNGITDIVELQVAIDALTVMVHPDNDFIDCLTVQQVHDLFKAGGATTWADIDPSWPDETIEFFFPGVDSGTFDYFVEAIIEGPDENATHRPTGEHETASEDDNVLALGIEENRNAIGYFGFAYFLEAGDRLKPVQIDGGEGCVEPSFEAALDGSYTPLSRPLFIYSSADIMSAKPEVVGFSYFYLENVEALVPEVGYVSMPEDLLQEQFDKLEPFLP